MRLNDHNISSIQIASFAILFSLIATHHALVKAEDVYRCGGQYTNDFELIKNKKCELLLRSSSVTVYSEQKNNSNFSKKRAILSLENNKPQSTSQNQRVTSQEKRDQEAKEIIEEELKKTNLQLIELKKQHTEELSSKHQTKNHDLSQKIKRLEADIESLKKEIKHY